MPFPPFLGVAAWSPGPRRKSLCASAPGPAMKGAFFSIECCICLRQRDYALLRAGGHACTPHLAWTVVWRPVTPFLTPFLTGWPAQQ